MKKLAYKSGMLLIVAVMLFTGTLFAQQVTKEFHKEFNATPNTTLDLSNRYGKVVVETWDQDKIIIDVKVLVELPSRERAEKLITYIDIQFTEGESVVGAKTVIDEKFNFSGWGGGSRRFSIDYNVKMPVNANLKLSNRYGNTDLEELNGVVNLDIKYGNLTADKLGRGNEKPLNYLSLAYGKADIESAGWLDVSVRYSGGLNINKSQALLLDSKYSKIQVEETSSIVGESKYDNIRIQKINNLVIDCGYTDLNIASLSKKLKLDGGYGAVSVEQVSAGFESVEIDTRYIGVRLGIDDNANYKLDARLSYGDLRFNEDNFRHERHIVENNSKEISGVVGKEDSPAARVYVRSSYGTVKLY